MATKTTYWTGGVSGYEYAYNVPGDIAKLAQTFTLDAEYDVEYVVLLGKKGLNTPTTVTVHLCTLSGGDPDASQGSIAIDASGWGTGGANRTFTFDTPISLSSGTYAIVIMSGTERSTSFGLSGAGVGPGIAKKNSINDGLWYNETTPNSTFYFEVWVSDAAPTKPTNPSPTNNDTEVDFSGLTLSWSDGGGADTYDVYIGTFSYQSKVSAAQEGTSYTTTLAELQSIYGITPINQKIYWRVDATNDEGTTTGDEWNFDARPGAVTVTVPTDETSGIALHSTTGSWTAPANADSYDVYFGTLSGFVSFVENTEEVLSILTPRNFNYGYIYYWKVKAKNDFGTTDSAEFYFTTLIFKPASPSYWSGTIWYRALTETGIDGVEGVDWEEAYQPNFINTNRRLVAATKNSIYYEDI